MNLPQVAADAQITTVLSHVLGRDITRLQSEPQVSDVPGTVFKVAALDNDRNEYPLILKRRSDDRDYQLYKHYLEPYRLNSPRIYGILRWMAKAFSLWTIFGMCPRRGVIAIVTWKL